MTVSVSWLSLRTMLDVDLLARGPRTKTINLQGEQCPLNVFPNASFCYLPGFRLLLALANIWA
eukprot:1468280-Pleurochrysis_carterae.AAC.1